MSFYGNYYWIGDYPERTEEEELERRRLRDEHLEQAWERKHEEGDDGRDIAVTRRH